MSSSDKVLSIIHVLLESNEVPNCPLVSFIRRFRELQSLCSKGDQGADIEGVLRKLSGALSSEISHISESRIAAGRKCEQLRRELAKEEDHLRELQEHENEVKQLYTLSLVASNVRFGGNIENSSSEKEKDSSLSEKRKETLAVHKEAKNVTWLRDHSLVGSSIQEEGCFLGGTSEAHSPTPAAIPAQSENRIQRGKNDTFSVLKQSLLSVLQSSTESDESVLAILQEIKKEIFVGPVNSLEECRLRIHICDFGELVVAISKFLSDHPPPVQVVLLNLIEHTFNLNFTPGEEYCDECESSLVRTIERLISDEICFVEVLVRLLSSVNDVVKNEALKCLSPLLGVPPHLCFLGTKKSSSVLNCSSVYTVVMDRFLRRSGLNGVMSIILRSTSEICLERALVLLWNLLLNVDDAHFKKLFPSSMGSYICKLGGLKSLDLFYTDSLRIADNVATLINCLTLEDDANDKMREDGSLEKIVSLLCNPFTSIQSKITGAVCNCTSKAENRRVLRQLGAVPQLLDILHSTPEENELNEMTAKHATAALRNLSLENESISEIISYQGIKVLLRLIETSKNIEVVKNAAGALLNCSKSLQTSAIIRSMGKGISILLELFDEAELKKRFSAVKEMKTELLDIVVGIMKNCAIGEENRRAVIAGGGVQAIVFLLQQFADKKETPALQKTVDKLASTLWNLTVSEEGKAALSCTPKGFDTVLRLLEASSTVCSFCECPNRSHFSPFSGDISSLLMEMSNGSDESLKKIVEMLRPKSPLLRIGMSTREKLIGIIRNCSTRKENKPALVCNGAIAVLVGSFWDCFSTWSTFRTVAMTSTHKVSSELCRPSPQLCETIAGTLWDLAKENKSIFYQQGALEVLCVFIQGRNSMPTALEPAAGALCILTANNKENCEALLRFGGIYSLLKLASKLAQEFSHEMKRLSEKTLQKDVMLYTLLAIRNSTCTSSLVRWYVIDYASLNSHEFAGTLIRLLSCPEEDCVKEAAYIIKNLCTSDELHQFFVLKGVGSRLNRLISESSSSAVLSACKSSLKSIERVS